MLQLYNSSFFYAIKRKRSQNLSRFCFSPSYFPTALSSGLSPIPFFLARFHQQNPGTRNPCPLSKSRYAHIESAVLYPFPKPSPGTSAKPHVLTQPRQAPFQKNSLTLFPQTAPTDIPRSTGLKSYKPDGLATRSGTFTPLTDKPWAERKTHNRYPPVYWGFYRKGTFGCLFVTAPNGADLSPDVHEILHNV